MRWENSDPHTYRSPARAVSRVVQHRLADTAGHADGIREREEMGVQHTGEHLFFAGGI